ncbi:hypothetical protein CYMTET_31275 [Cymbomonas tetramitiformis]|uniref:Uncharacterized protein n=1 Tax=Cymbomonas tetramitiformis TaxID=36881 RepID=A0AAE0FHV9_9CHLO|nr:hypothetical protein CYMTET_31275 [Cymbomonas tetramitiformis]
MGIVATYNVDNDPDYDLNYGNNCSFPWDSVTAACVEGGDSYGEDWCGDTWCYVPSYCPGATLTEFFDKYVSGDQAIYYSYDQCGSEDTFTDTFTDCADDCGTTQPSTCDEFTTMTTGEGCAADCSLDFLTDFLADIGLDCSGE